MRLSGAYREGDLPALLAKFRPHLVWFPASWPETWSFTLSAAIDAGLPIAAASIGAFPERLSGRSLTWLTPPSMDPADYLALFRSVAEGETGHAFGHFDFLAEVGDPATGVAVGASEDNLKSAVAGETYEYTEMYPGFARTARDEGLEEVAEWLETLARAEKSHAGRFQAALESIS